MKQIAIIGAPGSGKTEFAEALAEKIEGDVAVIDNYIPEIETECDLKLGTAATYIGNLYAVLGRYARERTAALEGPAAVITCGTLIESSVYATLQAVAGQTELHWVRISNFMNTLGTFYQDTWRYTDVFYLPLANPDPNTPEGQIDVSTRMAMEAFGVKSMTLSESLEENLSKAIDALDNSEAEQSVAETY